MKNIRKISLLVVFLTICLGGGAELTSAAESLEVAVALDYNVVSDKVVCYEVRDARGEAESQGYLYLEKFAQAKQWLSRNYTPQLMSGVCEGEEASGGDQASYHMVIFYKCGGVGCQSVSEQMSEFIVEQQDKFQHAQVAFVNFHAAQASLRRAIHEKLTNVHSD